MARMDGLIRGRARLLVFYFLVLRGEVAAVNGTECGGTYRGTRYFVTSPNYPGNYPVNRDCRYVLTSSRDSICDPEFRLTFVTFSVESSANCTKDYLRIVEAGSNASRSSGDICGNVAGTKDLRGRRGSDPAIIFHSDDDAGDKGFKILVEAIPCRENGAVLQAQDRVSYDSHRPEVEFADEDVESVPLPPKITSYLYLPAETEGRTLKTGSKHRPHRPQNSTTRPATLLGQQAGNSSWTIHALPTDLQLPTANEPVVFRENKVEPEKIIGPPTSGTPATVYGVPQNPTNSFDPLANEHPGQHANCNGRDDGSGSGGTFYPNSNNFPNFPSYPSSNDYPNSNNVPNSNNYPTSNNYPNANNYPSGNNYPNTNNYPSGNYPNVNYPNPNNYPNGVNYPNSVGNCGNNRPATTTPRPGNNYYPRSNCGGDANWNIVPSANGGGNVDGQTPIVGWNWNDNAPREPTSGYDWSFSVNTNVGPSGYVPYYIPFTATSTECCGTVYSSDNFYLTSPGFPALTHSSTSYDCQYTIQRTSASVCALTLNFNYFYFGAEDQFCTYGYIEIDDQRYCGCRTGTNVTVSFDDLYTKVIKVRYLGYPKIKFNGFFIQASQASCATAYSRFKGISRTIAARTDNDRGNRGRRSPPANIDDTSTRSIEKRQLGYEYQKPSAQLSVLTNFLPSLPTSCQALKFFNWVVAAKQVYLRNARCSSTATTTTATLVSVVPILPIFPTADHAGIFGVQGTTPPNCDEINVTEGTIASPYHPANYANNLIRCYRFHKAPGYCQLELAMLDFDLESSTACRKDFVTFGGQNRRYCGNSLAGSRAIIDLSTVSTADLYFVTDSTGTGRGFRAGFSQISC